ncbi:MAG: hypothetical protein ACTHM1_06725 [Solirubrobacteraceae bacterium]
MPVNEVVVVAGVLVAAVNGVAAIVGAWSWHRHAPSRLFWVLLRVGQIAALLFAAGVGALAATGRNSSDSLFYLYALLPPAVAFVAEQLRIASAQTILDQRGLPNAQAVGELPEGDQHRLVAAIVRRETGVMALSAIVVVFLALRAAETAHGL